mmetsp:Transcript_26924/g.59172  ORF Transcript_26924/g.59172 Transcript_26924/m.59172 type:complete len:94 (-) Transcript_26924:749-1030(-)
MHARMRSRTCGHVYNTAPVHMQAYARTRTHPHACTTARTHARTHKHTHARMQARKQPPKNRHSSLSILSSSHLLALLSAIPSKCHGTAPTYSR